MIIENQKLAFSFSPLLHAEVNRAILPAVITHTELIYLRRKRRTRLMGWLRNCNSGWISLVDSSWGNGTSMHGVLHLLAIYNLV